MALDPFMPILVVDDHAAMIGIFRTLLRQLGFVDVDEAKDGTEALTKMRIKRYELVLSDWHMQPMNGYDLLREVRADPSLKRTLFMMVTGEARSENVVAAKKAGAHSYMIKPFDLHTLKDKIERVLATRSAPIAAAAPEAAKISEALPEAADTTHLVFKGRFTGQS